MQDASKFGCADCLHPDKQVLYTAILNLMKQYGVVPTELLREIETIRQSKPQPKRSLCVTCLMKERCPDSTREGGVWHCKYYR